jgi:hypothetical protein
MRVETKALCYEECKGKCKRKDKKSINKRGPSGEREREIL